jgi:hypothetical protein
VTTPPLAPVIPSRALNAAIAIHSLYLFLSVPCRAQSEAPDAEGEGRHLRHQSQPPLWRFMGERGGGRKLIGAGQVL